MAYRYSDDALDLADYDEPRLSHDEILARNLRWDCHRDLRVAKGRPAYRVATIQWRGDWKHYPRNGETVAPDPILNLHALRSAATRRGFNPHAAVRYGEQRALATSPNTVRLP